MASYHGQFVNPVGSWRVASRPTVEDPEVLEYFVEVLREEARTIDGVTGTFSYWSPHTSVQLFDEPSDAEEWLEAMEEKYEADYDEYLEENRYEIAQMERYEQWRNEY